MFVSARRVIPSVSYERLSFERTFAANWAGPAHVRLCCRQGSVTWPLASSTPWSVRPSVVFIRHVIVLVPSPLLCKFGRSAEATAAKPVLRLSITTASRIVAALFALPMGLFATMDVPFRLPCPAGRDPFQAARLERVASGESYYPGVRHS